MCKVDLDQDLISSTRTIYHVLGGVSAPEIRDAAIGGLKAVYTGVFVLPAR